jgi:hypothetical protein
MTSPSLVPRPAVDAAPLTLLSCCTAAAKFALLDRAVLIELPFSFDPGDLDTKANNLPHEPIQNTKPKTIAITTTGSSTNQASTHPSVNRITFGDMARE